MIFALLTLGFILYWLFEWEFFFWLGMLGLVLYLGGLLDANVQP